MGFRSKGVMMASYRNPRSYVEALRTDPSRHAIVSLPLAAEALGVTKGTIDRMLHDGRLEEVSIEGLSDEKRLRAVQAEGVWRILDDRRADGGRVEELLLAGHGQPLFYDEVMRHIGLRSDRSVDRRRIGEILDAVSRRSHHEHGFLLSVLVHRKPMQPHHPSRPSDGFFRLAQSLGLGDESEAVYGDQMGKVREYFSSRAS